MCKNSLKPIINRQTASIGDLITKFQISSRRHVKGRYAVPFKSRGYTYILYICIYICRSVYMYIQSIASEQARVQSLCVPYSTQSRGMHRLQYILYISTVYIYIHITIGKLVQRALLGSLQCISTVWNATRRHPYIYVRIYQERSSL